MGVLYYIFMFHEGHGRGPVSLSHRTILISAGVPSKKVSFEATPFFFVALDMDPDLEVLILTSSVP